MVARALWIEVLLELGRTLDVGEECGDRFALAFDGFGRYNITYPNRFSFLN